MDIRLSEAVAAVRAELLQAEIEGRGKEVTFAVGPVQMEFEVELRADATAKAGFRVWAVSAEAGGAVSRSRTHRVSFTLTPRRAGTGLEIADRVDGSGPGDLSEHVEGY